MLMACVIGGRSAGRLRVMAAMEFAAYAQNLALMGRSGALLNSDPLLARPLDGAQVEAGRSDAAA